jgi:hypothetical protein
MSTARRVSEVMRVDRLDSGQRRLVRDLVIDLGVTLDIPPDEYEGFTRSQAGTTVVTVPEGFETDFSSVPAFARALYRFDSIDLAGCCHDRAYQVGVPRSAADRVWKIVATSGRRRVGKLRGWLGWLGLRVGGGFAYRPAADPPTHPD